MIYADYNGSAPLDKEVLRFLHKRLDEGPYANPNASHYEGLEVSKLMEAARDRCAKFLGATADQVIFNSGSSEGITTIFSSIIALRDAPRLKGRDTIIISNVEHPAVVEAAKSCLEAGFKIQEIEVDDQGYLEIKDLADYLEKHHAKVALVSIMGANNETGVIFPLQEIGGLCHKYNILYFSDTTQYIGKVDFDFEDLFCDFAVGSGHKMGGMTGSGFILVKDKDYLKSLILGGGQEGGLRAGTQNYIGNETLAVALEASMKKIDDTAKCSDARDHFENCLKKKYPEMVIFGDQTERLATTSLLSFPGLEGGRIQHALKKEKIMITTSSACSDAKKGPSRIVTAMGGDEKTSKGVVRISLGMSKKIKEEYEQIFSAMCKVIDRLKTI